MRYENAPDACFSCAQLMRMKRGETVLWKGIVTQLTSKGKSVRKIRAMVVTDAAIYKAKTDNLSKATGTIPIGEVDRVDYSINDVTFEIVTKKSTITYSSGDVQAIVGHIDRSKIRWRSSMGKGPPPAPLLRCIDSKARNPIHQQIDAAYRKHRATGGRDPSFDRKAHMHRTTTTTNNLANFRLCFCLAGYMACPRVHGPFSEDAKRLESAVGVVAKDGASALTAPVPEEPNLAAASSTKSKPPPLPPRPHASRGRRPMSAKKLEAMASARSRASAGREQAQAGEARRNDRALLRLLTLNSELRRGGIHVLNSRFSRDPKAYLERYATDTLSFTRKARAASRRRLSFRVQENMHIRNFLDTAVEPEVLVEAGAKLLQNVHRLGTFHTKFLEEHLQGLLDLPLIEGKRLFRKLEKQVAGQQYQLTGKIGEGAFGKVYVARVTRPTLGGKEGKLRVGDRIAVKMVDLSSEEDVGEIDKEIEALAGGEICPQLITFFGSQAISRYLLVFMELMDGSLADIKPLPEKAVAICMRESLKGLSFLWQKFRVFHRDLKAANILFSCNGEVKLADFGTVRSLDGTIKKAMTTVGTPHWMAPEIIRGGEYDQMADIWSLGITAYEIITGKVPNSNLRDVQVMQVAAAAEAPRLPQAYSAEACSFVAACLEKDPNERKSLQQLMETKLVRGAGPIGSWQPTKSRRRALLERDWESS